MKVPTGGDHELRPRVAARGSPRTPGRQSGADQVRVLGRRSESGWERATITTAVARATRRCRRRLLSLPRSPEVVPAPAGRSRARTVRDDEAMDRALALAAAARRRTAPNPWVGCVLVRDGEVVGEGATATARRRARRGRRAARGRRPRPRRHRVRHARALRPPRPHRRRAPTRSIAAGVARVVVALEDPDRAGRRAPASRGCGTRASTVEVGVGRATPRPRCSRRTCTTGAPAAPFVVAKVASSLDGRVAAADGTSQWITSADGARRRARAARRLAGDRVGSGTALADHPALTVRGVDAAARARRRCGSARRARPRARRRARCSTPTLAPTLVVTTERGRPARESTRGARRAPRSSRRRARAPTAASTSTRRSRCSAARVCSRRSSRAAARLLGARARRRPRAAPRRVRRTARCSATDGPPGFAFAGPRHDRRRAALRARRRHAQLGPDVRLDYEVAA